MAGAPAHTSHRTFSTSVRQDGVEPSFAAVVVKAALVSVGARIVAPCGCQAIVTAVSRTTIRFRVTRALGCRRTGRRHIAGIDWDDCGVDDDIRLQGRDELETARGDRVGRM